MDNIVVTKTKLLAIMKTNREQHHASSSRPRPASARR